jgi:YggT family protein
MFPAPRLPIPIASLFVTWGIGFLIIAMFVRAIASWFRIDERYAIIRFLARLTDPFITPVRRVVRPVGFIDLSFFIAWFMLSTLQLLLLQALPPGW